MNSKKDQLIALDRLLTIMDELREQCPWDRKQTMESLRHLTIEEVYELGDAILDKDRDEIKKELGDILLHIVFYSKIGSETGHFDIGDVANSICDKLIDRHPHIYGDTKAEDEEQVVDPIEDVHQIAEKGVGGSDGRIGLFADQADLGHPLAEGLARLAAHNPSVVDVPTEAGEHHRQPGVVSGRRVVDHPRRDGEGRTLLHHKHGGGGTRTPKRLPAPHFECGALPVRTTPPSFSRDGRI